MAALSILDLVRVTEDTDARGALDNARDLAAHAEDWGYRRFWVAEHHNMPGIASAATSVVIAHIAAGDQRIRVGAGGIMLPNHAPLVIAEQFGTLARLFPGRIDLGLGRAPGTDQMTRPRVAPLARGRRQFSAGRARAAGLFRARRPGPAHPGRAGGGNRSAAVDPRDRALSARSSPPNSACPMPSPRISRRTCCCRRCEIYRSRFKPSEQLDRPYAMVGVNIIAAETDAEARRLATTQQMSFTNMFRGARGLSQPPIDDIETYWSPMREGAGDAHARPLHRRLARNGARRHRRARRRDRRRRADGRLRRLRPRHAAAFVRADRSGARRPAPSCSNARRLEPASPATWCSVTNRTARRPSCV